jgi:hypothetical protein
MVAIDDLHFRLLLIAAFLDAAAGQIRDMSVTPVDDNLCNIANARTSVHDIIHSIYILRPDLERIPDR